MRGDDSESLRVIYRSLDERPSLPGHLRVAETDVSVAQGPVSVGIDVNGARCLLVPTSAAPPRRPEIRSFRGLSLSRRELEDPSLGLGTYLLLRCEAGELNTIFVNVAAAALASLDDDPSDPEATCLRVIDDFRRLFGRGERLTERDLAWLFAELRILEIVVDHGGGLGLWRGPEKQRHDYVSGTAAIEVKSTLSADHRRFTVHGLRQLEPPEEGSLFLHLVRIEPTVGGTTVPDLVERLRNAGIDPDRFEELLKKTGYRSEHEPDYGEIGFDVLEEETHRVDDGFPRLTTDDIELPPGVTSISYEVDLSSIGKLDGVGITAAVRELVAL
jgi:hypothetical protein